MAVWRSVDFDEIIEVSDESLELPQSEVATPTQVGASVWEEAQACEQQSRPAFHPPQGWSLGEEESACSSLSLVEESQEKMESSKMAPPKNAPRDALVSGRGGKPGTQEVPCVADPTERLAGRKGVACHLQLGDVSGKG
ncbi:hypothetical protein NN561_012445 [Cricetulus griseus]